jgi:hypothetical protein
MCPFMVYLHGHLGFMGAGMGFVSMGFSRIRQQIRELRDEQKRLLVLLMRPGKMVRGSITWQGKGEVSADGRNAHANLVRSIGGRSETRRVRDAHVGWLKELLEERTAHALRMRRWREIDKQIEALLGKLRYENLYDYEPTADSHLMRVSGELGGDE